MFFNKEISEEVKKLIHKMMKNDPEKRLSARQCLTLPWFMNKSQSRNLLENSRDGLIRRSTFKKIGAVNAERMRMEVVHDIIRNGLDTPEDRLQKSHSVCIDKGQFKNFIEGNTGLRNQN